MCRSFPRLIIACRRRLRSGFCNLGLQLSLDFLEVSEFICSMLVIVEEFASYIIFLFCHVGHEDRISDTAFLHQCSLNQILLVVFICDIGQIIFEDSKLSRYLVLLKLLGIQLWEYIFDRLAFILLAHEKVWISQR